jgi:predicted nucleotidyltransferase
VAGTTLLVAPRHITAVLGGHPCKVFLGCMPIVLLTLHYALDLRRRAWSVARTAAEVLRRRFGATRVVAFDSLARRDWFTPWSDIDLAAWGIPPDAFHRAVAAVTGISSEFQVDLVAPEDCRPALRQVVEQEGVSL